MNGLVRAKLLLRLIGILLIGLVLPRVVQGVWTAAAAMNWSSIQTRVILDWFAAIAGQVTLHGAASWSIRNLAPTLGFAVGCYLVLGGTGPVLRHLERRLGNG